MTFRKRRARSHAIAPHHNSNEGPKKPKPIHRNTYGPHPLRTTLAVLTGSITALSATLLLQSTVAAQLAPASIRAMASFTPQPSTKPGTRVEANRLISGQVPSNAIAALSSTSLASPGLNAAGTPAGLAPSSGTVRAGAALPPVPSVRPVGTVLATGAGPLDSVGNVASVQLASIIEEMPEGDLGPLVLASGAITLNARSRDDISSAQVDQRILAMLLAVSFEHQIEVTVLRSGHSKYVKGTKRLSNHVSGRAVDIGAVDGRLVRQSNKAARSILDQLLALPSPIRPTEIGSPWNTDAPETFTDSGHDDHLHIGFDS
jgi:hypothetical protein